MNFEVIFPLAFVGTGGLTLLFEKWLGRWGARKHSKESGALLDRFESRHRLSVLLIGVGSAWLLLNLV